MGNRGRPRKGYHKAEPPFEARPDQAPGAGTGAGPGPFGPGPFGGDREGGDGADGGREAAGAGSAAGTGAPPHRPTGTTRIERRKLARKVRRKRRRSLVKEVPLLVGVALLIALVLKTFLLQAFVIPSGSMEQTIRIGDRVLVDKLTPWFGAEPHRGDVVVFKDPGGWLANEPKPKPDPPVVKQVKQFFTYIGLLPASGEQDLIKRVIGVGGDTVACCDPQGRITVNGTPLTEPYLYAGNPPSMMTFTVHVPQGHLWVMGDHRSDSADSRSHMRAAGGGTIPENLVVGRAFVIAWPFDHWRRLKEPGTYASVPAPGAAGKRPTGSATRVGRANNGQRTSRLPTPAELPLVMGVAGLRRKRGRRRSGVRSGCGGPGGRRTVWIRRAREGGCRGAPGTSCRRCDGRGRPAARVRPERRPGGERRPAPERDRRSSGERGPSGSGRARSTGRRGARPDRRRGGCPGVRCAGPDGGAAPLRRSRRQGRRAP